ncbi:mitochondrial 37S ribosomal protein rsm10 [Tilletia horrida]|uniref:Small ribosomal subunit protein uS10m n=1 Tax=Tilletia horrida TaxID=155126 RepID=A0AAN6GN02_9BASI|nr:mitochondrial 37S ribosomal protein rsm10 [Tilletia horrida]KAK0552285.1 mitochondrial 37S ribosomal protein rsm10 [Tilletia horrida]
MSASRTLLNVSRRSRAVAHFSAPAFSGAFVNAGPSRWFASSTSRTQAQETNVEPQGAAPSEGSAQSSSNITSQSTESPKPPAASNFVPPPIPTTFDELRFFQPPESPPLTHGVHVASLTLQTYGPTLPNLENFSTFALRVMGALGIPHSGIARLPTRTSLWTVPKSPFVHKKAQENFERRTHRRVIKMWDANPDVVDRCFAFLREHSMAEVQMKAQIFRYVDLPLSKQEGEETPDADLTVPIADSAEAKAQEPRQ